MNQPKIFKGITGYVEVYPDKAIKYTEFSQLYWIREYAILTYLSKYNGSNICAYDRVQFRDINGKLYFTAQMPNYGEALCDVPPLNDHHMTQILLDIVTSLKLIHQKDIIHRDIKPENIMIKNHRATLIDFTHSLHLYKNYTQQLDTAIFTYIYRPPEITAFIESGDSKHPYGTSADMWSLGAVLFEMVTCKPLYKIFDVTTEEQCAAAYTGKNFMTKVKRNFKCSLHYAEFYKIITLSLLDPTPSKRITANQLYDILIKSLAGKKNFIMPSVVCKRMPSAIIIGEYDQNLFSQCETYITQQRCYKIPIYLMETMVKFFISRSVINSQNYRSAIAALGIMCDAYQFDYLGDLYGVAKKTNLREVQKCMMEMLKYHDDLFINMYV